MPSLESWLAAMPSLQTFGPVGSHLHPLHGAAGAVIRSLGDPTCGVHAICARRSRALSWPLGPPGHGVLDESFP